jgi:hypothetical protein
VAVAQQYSYEYWIRWGDPPEVVRAGAFGVGLDPLVEVQSNHLVLRPRSPGRWAYTELKIPLPPGIQDDDFLRLQSTPLNAHRSLGWWRWGELQFHAGDLQALSGERLGKAMLEVVNEHDLDGCLAIYQRQQQWRLRPGERVVLGNHHLFLQALGGAVTGRSYRADGWAAHQRFSAPEAQQWASQWLPP